MTRNVIGLDIGGANLKAATNQGGARSRPFELWKSPERLGGELTKLLRGWRPAALAVTMTGELCDCFPTRRDGVRQILAQVKRAFPTLPIHVWSTQGKFITPAAAKKRPLSVASANWHALATWAGQTITLEGATSPPKAMLLVDVGSTTTDIVPIVLGKPTPVGFTDSERLKSEELVYTGVKRTPVCALIQEEIMAEFFATTHDVYLVLGLTAENKADRQTADGRPATRAFAHARLARMLGGDSENVSAEDVSHLAGEVLGHQVILLYNAFKTVVNRIPHRPTILITSGSGAFLAEKAWRYYSSDKLWTVALAETMGPDLSSAACAYAVAQLARPK